MVADHAEDEGFDCGPPSSPDLHLRDGAVVRFPAVMGILNTTPDSFYDGGRYLAHARADARALEMASQGADIIDIGGESTRPGAEKVPVEVELDRVMPVLRALRGRLSCPISIDTRKAAVAEASLAGGASIVNDVSAMTFDPAMAGVVARAGAAVILMHMRGTPENMMSLTDYDDVAAEVSDYLAARARAAIEAGVAPSRIILDPGIGFAKNTGQNLRLLTCLPRLSRLGYPILVGVSRKRIVRELTGPDDRDLLFGTAAAVALAVVSGASIVRVHDPGPMAAVVKMAAAIREAAPSRSR